MADNNFTFSVTIDLNRTIPYNSSIVIPATGEAHTFVPQYGITALDIGYLAVSSLDGLGVVTYNFSAIDLPITMYYDGSTNPTFVFDVTASNLSAHAGSYTDNVIFIASGLGTSLSAGVTGDMTETTWIGTVQSLSALGDVTAPDAVTNFYPTLSTDSIYLTWVNPTSLDWVETKIQKSEIGPITGVDVGSLIYTGSGTSFNDLSATDYSAIYYYGAYGVDNVGLTSSIVQISTKRLPLGYPQIPADFDPSFSQIDPLSPTEIKWTRYLRILSESEI